MIEPTSNSGKSTNADTPPKKRPRWTQEQRIIAFEKRQALIAKQATAVSLRAAGYTYAAISAQLGYKTSSAAQKAVERALKATLREPAEHYSRLKQERLETLLKSIWNNAIKGHLGSIDRALRIMSEIDDVVYPDGLPKAVDLREVALAAAIAEGLDPDDTAALMTDVEKWANRIPELGG